jgi:hypothetical protein
MICRSWSVYKILIKTCVSRFSINVKRLFMNIIYFYVNRKNAHRPNIRTCNSGFFDSLKGIRSSAFFPEIF